MYRFERGDKPAVDEAPRRQPGIVENRRNRLVVAPIELRAAIAAMMLPPTASTCC
jgi:hypothetical protein